ncbi:hypothetical protein LguiA_003988 [Lonicera macranthoides]
MKSFRLWVLFLVVGSALICFCFSNEATTYSSYGMAFTGSENHVSMTATNRKLKEKIDTQSSDKSEADNINLEDYRPIDPVPSSKASIRPGPIQHGTPLMPFIPKPSPSPPAPGPDHSKRGGFP